MSGKTIAWVLGIGAAVASSSIGGWIGRMSTIHERVAVVESRIGGIEKSVDSMTRKLDRVLERRTH